MLSELAKNRKHSENTKALISRALVGDNNPFYNKNHSTKSKLRMIEAKTASLPSPIRGGEKRMFIYIIRLENYLSFFHL